MVRSRVQAYAALLKAQLFFFAARLQPSQAASAAYVSPGARQSGACHVRVLRRNE